MRFNDRSPEIHFLYGLLDKCFQNYLKKDQSHFNLNENIDEQTLVNLIEGHRLEGIIFKAHSFPDKKGMIYQSLYNMHQNNSLAVAKMLSEMQSITDYLNHNSIQHLYMKGPLLSQALYNSPTVRGQGDIDILVQDEHLTSVLELLEAAGWISAHPSRSIDELYKESIGRTYVFFFDEFPLYKDGIYLDLHWRVAQGKSGFIQTEKLLSSSTLTKVGDFSFPSMNQSFLPLLCAHTAFWDDFFELRQHLDFRLCQALFQNNQLEHFGNFRKLYDYSERQISYIWYGRAFYENHGLSNKTLNNLYKTEFMIQNPELAQKRKFDGSVTLKLLGKLRYGSQIEIILYLVYRVTIRGLIKLFRRS